MVLLFSGLQEVKLGWSLLIIDCPGLAAHFCERDHLQNGCLIADCERRTNESRSPTTPRTYNVKDAGRTPHSSSWHDKFSPTCETVKEPKVFFGTTPVKAASGLVLLVYLGLLTVLDYFTFTTIHESMSHFMSATMFIWMTYGIVLMALYGLQKQSSFWMFPLFVYQVALFVTAFIIYGQATLRELIIGAPTLPLVCRLLTLIMFELALSVMHIYTTYITFVAFQFFRRSKWSRRLLPRSAQRGATLNREFDRIKLSPYGERIVPIVEQIEEPVVFFGTCFVQVVSGVIMLLYLGLLTYLDYVTFTTLHESVSRYFSATLFIWLSYFIVLMALIGIQRQSSLWIFPLLVYQIAVFSLAFMVYGYATVHEFQIGVPSVSLFCRLFTLVLFEATIGGLHLYATGITWINLQYYHRLMKAQRGLRYNGDPNSSLLTVSMAEEPDDLIVFSAIDNKIGSKKVVTFAE